MQGGRILVVDDEPTVRQAVSSVLVEEGYVVDQAANGVDALAKLSAHRPDAILLDLMMPVMNGRQCLDALRDHGHGDVPVVVMTAVHGLAQVGTRFGVQDVIEKPFDLDALLNKVALAVYRSLHGGPPADREPTPPDDPAAAPPDGSRGVVLLIDHDHGALRRLDALLSARGYTAVALPRPVDDLPRLARGLAPRAILLALAPDAGELATTALVAALRAQPGLAEVPICAFRRDHGDRGATGAWPGDDDLLRFVETARA